MLWIDIEDANGVKVGDGPMQCLSWEHSPRLSRAGVWRAEIPIGESKLQYATHKMRVRCYQATPFGVIDVGAGVIDSKLTKIAEGGSSIEIGGSDLLIELSYRLVFEDLHVVTSYTPLVKAVVGTLLTWFSWDGDEESPELVVEELNNYVYIGLVATTFNRIDFTFSQTNEIETELAVGVSDERGGDLYREPDDTEDTTDNAGAPLGQNGYIRFTRPASWFLREVDGVEAYWVRLDPAATLWSDESLEIGIQFDTISVSSYTPRLDDLSYLLETYAPDWSFSPLYYDSTEHGTMRTIDGESLLNVFVNLSEERGEWFRLGLDGRTIEWLRKEQPSSGVMALQAVGEWGLGTEASAPLIEDFVAEIPAPPAPPAAPTGLVAAPTGTNNLHVLLTWNDNSDNETGFIVEYSTNGSSWTELTTTAADVETYTHTTPTYGEATHYYRVRAGNGSGESANATDNLAGLLLGGMAYHAFETSSWLDSIGSADLVDINGGATITTGKIGNGADLSGGTFGQRLESTDGVYSHSGAFSYSIWSKWSAITMTTRLAILRTAADTRWELVVTPDGGGGRIYTGLQTVTFDLDTWYHCAYTYTGTNEAFYLNGSLVGTGAHSISAFDRLYLEAASANPHIADEDYFCKGRAWSAAEVAALYNSGAGLAYPF